MFILRNSKWAMLTAFMAFMLLMTTGCKKNDDSVSTDQLSEAEATQDAAEAVASAVAQDNGGSIDVIQDMLDIATPNGMAASADDGISNPSTVQKTYDSTTGWWTVTINRSKTSSSGHYYAIYQRVSKHQFLNKNGVFQKNYITVVNGINDTAYTINHEIVSGSGDAHSPKVSHHLLSLGGKWVATNTNTGIITINSVNGFPFNRAASDTVTRLNSIRTLNSTLTLSFANVTGPRVSRVNWHQATAGTITGHYHADVTFTKGDVYREKTIDRDIVITLGGQKLNIKVGNSSFQANPASGDLY